MKNIFLIFILLGPILAKADYRGAIKAYKHNRKNFKRLASELIDGGLYFSALPWVKSYLVRSQVRPDSGMDRKIEKMMRVTGTMTFESLPLKYLLRSNSPSIRYIVAKKYLNRYKFGKAIANARKIPKNHPLHPFALNLLGVAYSGQRQYSQSNRFFSQCLESSTQKDKVVTNHQLKLNHDLCVMGKARNAFAQKKYQKAELQYLDIAKSSLIWPWILHEEAWTSFYRKNYNRTLGKLVTYKAPLFDFIFNPEIEVLNAFSYYSLCLYDDANKVIKKHQHIFKKGALSLRSLLSRKRRNYRYFYNLIESSESSGGSFYSLGRLLKSIRKQGNYGELKRAISLAQKEEARLPSSRFGAILRRNIDDSIRSYQKLIGVYTYKKLMQAQRDLKKAMESLTYIRLEVLSKKKRSLYKKGPAGNGKKRGDISYLSPNEKQYFWGFNGEFWADELGDYVFALRSECQ